MAKNNPTKKQIKAKIISMRQDENWQKRKCKVYRYKLQGKIYIINHNYLCEYFFFWIIFCYF